MIVMADCIDMPSVHFTPKIMDLAFNVIIDYNPASLVVVLTCASNAKALIQPMIHIHTSLDFFMYACVRLALTSLQRREGSQATSQI